MDLKTLADQIERLRRRFGLKALDDEFVKLVKRELMDMGSDDMIRMTDVMIGTRPATKPPTIVDFREARLRLERGKFNREVIGASGAWDKMALPSTLSKFWPGCKTAMEAVEVEKLKIKIARANGG